MFLVMFDVMRNYDKLPYIMYDISRTYDEIFFSISVFLAMLDV